MIKAAGRIGVFGDIHAQHEGVAAGLGFFRERGVDRVLSVGVIVDGDGDVDRCVELLRGVGALGVRGNHERWMLGGTDLGLSDATRIDSLADDTVRWLTELPVTRSVPTVAGAAMLCHAMGDDDMHGVHPHTAQWELDHTPAWWRIVGDLAHYRVAIAGHTHQRMAKAIGPLVWLNAGTLAPSHDPCVMLVDLAEGWVAWHPAVGPWVGEEPIERVELPRPRG